MMNTNILNMINFEFIYQGKPADFFVESVDFGKFMLSNYGKYLGINRNMKTTQSNVCRRRNAKHSTCKSASSLNTQEWSS